MLSKTNSNPPKIAEIGEKINKKACDFPFQLQLFAGFEAQINGQALPFRTDKIRALVAYLGVEEKIPHGRVKLANLLWGEQGEATARKNLRNSLSRLKQAIKKVAPQESEHILQISRQSVALMPAFTYCDIQEFSHLISKIEAHRHADLFTCSSCLENLQAAAALYHGDFMAGFFIDDAPDFEQWLVVKRESLHQQAIILLDTLCTLHQQQGNYKLLLNYAQQLVHLEPWQETAHGYLISAWLGLGNWQQAEQQWQQCRQILQEHLNISPSPSTVALAKQIKAFRQKQTKPLPPLPEISFPSIQPAHNLTFPLTKYVGRTKERADLLQLVTDPHHRFITLVGAGGMGKTRLATETAISVLNEQESPFPDGIWFVPLADIHPDQDNTAQLIAAAVAKAMGHPLQPFPLPGQQIQQMLRTRRLLLILDNFEHMLSAADVVHNWLTYAPNLTIVCTSREALHFAAEMIFPVRPLPIPEPVPPINLEEFRQNESLQLFINRVQQTHSDIPQTTENITEIVTICRLLGGNPLAIELAVANLRKYTLLGLREAIQQNLDQLATTWRDMPARHRSIRAVFLTSWQHLSLAAQHLLAHLALFQGGFTVEAVTTITGHSSKQLEELVTKSLLQPSQGGRYTLHELLRQFCAERLAELGATRSGHNRHSDYYLRWIHDLTPILFGETPEKASNLITDEWENVAQAWQVAVADENVQGISGILPGIHRFCELSGMFHQVDELLRLALQKCKHSSMKQAMQACRQIRWQRAYCLYQLTNFSSAKALIQQVITDSQATNDMVCLGKATLLWGLIEQAVGEPESARTLYEKALTIARQHQQSRLAIHCLSHLNYFITESNDYCQQALRQVLPLQDSWLTCRVYDRLGVSLANAGDFEEARRYFQLAHEKTYWMSPTNPHKISFLNQQATISWLLADYQTAVGLYERTLQIVRSDASVYTSIQWGLARVYRAMGQLESALQAGQSALRLLQPTGGQADIITSYNSLGHIWQAMGDVTEARRAYETANYLAEVNNLPMFGVEGYAGLAVLYQQQGDRVQAMAYVEKVLGFINAGNELNVITEPIQIYRQCLTILEANKQFKKAKTLRQKAQQQRQTQANFITDPVLKQQFLAIHTL